MNITPLVYWINTREALRLRKLAGEPPPWTDDPILQKYRFCNVRREDDRVTHWIRENIREPYATSPDLWFMLCVARMVNWPPSLQEIMDHAAAWPGDTDFTPIRLGQVLERRTRRHEKVWTGAYMIHPVNANKWSSKASFVGNVVLGGLWKSREKIRDHLIISPRERSLEKIFNLISAHHAWGPFMTYQAVVDMRFTSLLSEAKDRSKWAAAGPGTVYGLNYVFDRPRRQALSQPRALEELRHVDEALREETSVQFDFSDVPNILCETAKYLRLQREGIAPRMIYRPFGGEY